MAMEPKVPNFCADCGNAGMTLKIPPGDERLRACCDQCGRIEYQNPKIVVACVVFAKSKAKEENNNIKNKYNRVLLAKRAIEPRLGTWGIPQGFMEHGETTRQAAVREVYEETGAIIDPDSLKFRAVYNVPGSVQLVYEARVADVIQLQQDIESYQHAHESLKVELLSFEEIDSKEICFPTVSWALEHCRSLLDDSEITMKGQAKIQQMTKLYNAELEQWSQYEDEK